MSRMNLLIGPQGPVVDVFVGVSQARLNAIRAAGQPDPQVERARLLVDTGASNTNICVSVIGRLGITATGQVPVNTPSTDGVPVFMDQYDVNLYFIFAGTAGPTSGGSHTIPTIPITCANFQNTGIQGLLGRDILSKTSLVYLGDINVCSLNF